MKPSTLRFSLICDSANIETAERVIKPFRTAPNFADFRIRLSLERNGSLQQLANEISMRSMGYRYPSSQLPFRYLDLPLEIRFKILEYTDLVTPLRQVEWSSKNKFGIHYSALSCGNECGWKGPCSPIRYPSCQFRNCWRLDQENSGCFCQNHHAAFSSICRCWVPPTSLFLVCRELQQNAEAVFYAKNRFVIVPPLFECYEPVRSTPDRLDVSKFLRDFVSPEAVGFLKYLDVVFPPFYDDYLGYDEPAYQDWLQTIDHIGNLANLPMLTLRVSMADIDLEPQYLDEYRTRMSIEKRNTILKVYHRVLKPLLKLRGKGLDRLTFFVDLILPVAHTPRFQTQIQENPNYCCAMRTTLRLWGERMVMGSEYDSEKLRTGKPEDAQWQMRSFESVYC
ncbi:hypothetical protein LARI1_G005821 [Lachnellula arida]|uniref:F-box domain-containing protein n=1 Tax=Lachnellula arida TaxID=1316785 RepID=A0A8T9BA58_9HELO|nr:hypothetical protein LARI1_G005821 [Lachnellula arida]